MTTTSKLGRTLVTLTALYLLSACSSGFSPSSSTASTTPGNSGQSTGGSGGSGNGTTTNPVDAVDLKGYSSGGQTDGSLVVDLDKVNMALVVSVPITLSGLNMGVNVSPAQYPDIQFYNYIDTNGFSRVAVRIPLKYILRGISLGDPTTLPNGEMIPFLGGELPSTNVVINAVDKSKVYLYIGSGAVAVYVSHPAIPSLISLNYYIKNSTKTAIIGAVGIARKTTVGDGGFVLSARIPADIAKVLDNSLSGF